MISRKNFLGGMLAAGAAPTLAVSYTHLTLPTSITV